MKRTVKIGTRDSQLAIWQATQVKNLLEQNDFSAELIFIKTTGDINTVTPLYELGVQGIFTKTLDIALIDNRIDIAVHSMKDVPTKLASGIEQAAVLKRASYKDIIVFKNDKSFLDNNNSYATIATSSIRRKAQWLRRFPNHKIENLRGNINTRLQKIETHNWDGAIFAAAGLERINLRPENSIDLDWMLPAPAQGAIMIVCREDDEFTFECCKAFNDAETALCVKIERDFLRTLQGGCSTPISALAEIDGNEIIFRGNICSIDGKEIFEIEKNVSSASENTGVEMAGEVLQNEKAARIMNAIRNENE